MNVIEQNGERYVATGEVRKVKRDEYFMDKTNNLRQFHMDESLAEWPIYHKLDKRTVSFVLDEAHGEFSDISLRAYLKYRKNNSSWCSFILAHLESLEK